MLAATIALAQTGSIQGTVTDSVGAVVQGAEITVKNLGSNAVRTVTSSGTGSFSVPSLPPGTTMSRSKWQASRLSMFQTFHSTVAQVLSLNVQLEPGAVTEEVQVRADQIPDVDLETSQISNLVDERSIKDLPLITRNPYELVLLSPGASQNTNAGLTVNGSRDRNNNFLLDGVDNNDTSVPGFELPGEALGANPDSTQEFRVITNNFNAEFGRNTGAIIDVVTRAEPTSSTEMPTSLAAGTPSGVRGIRSTGRRPVHRTPTSVTSSATPSEVPYARIRRSSFSTTSCNVSALRLQTPRSYPQQPSKVAFSVITETQWI